MKSDAEIEALRATPREDLSARLSLARALLERGLDDEVLAVVGWLWEHSLRLKPSWAGVRGSFLFHGVIAPLIVRSPAARARFVAFRDDAGHRRDAGSFGDFVKLNALLGEKTRTLDWLRAASPETAEAVRFYAHQEVLALVRDHGEWALFAKLIKDHRAVLSAEQNGLERLRTTAPEVFASLHPRAGELARAMSRGLRALEREAEARRVDELATEYEARSPPQLN